LNQIAQARNAQKEQEVNQLNDSTATTTNEGYNNRNEMEVVNTDGNNQNEEINSNGGKVKFPNESNKADGSSKNDDIITSSMVMLDSIDNVVITKTNNNNPNVITISNQNTKVSTDQATTSSDAQITNQDSDSESDNYFSDFNIKRFSSKGGDH
jgi:hypothetical protein